MPKTKRHLKLRASTRIFPGITETTQSLQEQYRMMLEQRKGQEKTILSQAKELRQLRSRRELEGLAIKIDVAIGTLQRRLRTIQQCLIALDAFKETKLDG